MLTGSSECQIGGIRWHKIHFPPHFELLPPLRMDFSAPRAELGERCSSLGVLTHTSSVCFCHVSPGITFSTLDARSRGWVGWDTLCHTLLTIRGDAVWQKRATLGRRSVEKTTLRQNTLFLSARPLSLL